MTDATPSRSLSAPVSTTTAVSGAWAVSSSTPRVPLASGRPTSRSTQSATCARSSASASDATRSTSAPGTVVEQLADEEGVAVVVFHEEDVAGCRRLGCGGPQLGRAYRPGAATWR